MKKADPFALLEQARREGRHSDTPSLLFGGCQRWVDAIHHVTLEGKRLCSRYRSGRSPDWLKFKNPDAPAVKREAEEDWN